MRHAATIELSRRRTHLGAAGVWRKTGRSNGEPTARSAANFLGGSAMRPIVALGVAFAAALSLLAADVADAKRLGGGRSLGTQRQSIAPAPAPSAAAPSGAAANPVMPAQPGVAGARPTPAAPAASGASRWLAPLAGIAAGIGLAAL